MLAYGPVQKTVKLKYLNCIQLGGKYALCVAISS